MRLTARVAGFLLVFSFSSWAGSFHVTVDGTAMGDGSQAAPWSLSAALYNPLLVRGGDTLFIHGGTYQGPFACRLSGQSGRPVVVMPYKGERVILQPPANKNVNAVLTFDGSYCYIIGLYIQSRIENRVSAQAGSSPGDVVTTDGVYFTGNNNKLINCVIENNGGSGVGFWSSAIDSEIYGSIIYHNGWMGPDRGHGHAIYGQNETGIKKITNNIIFNSFGLGVHVYSEGGSIQGFDIARNIFLNSGRLSGVLERSILIGGGQPAARIRITDNCFYHDAGLPDKAALQMGYSAPNVDAVVEGNYIVGGNEALAVIRPWENITIARNTLINASRTVRADIPPGHSGYKWNQNSYFVGSINGQSLSEWQIQYGFDANSTYSARLPQTNRVFVFPNEFERSRANVAIYNWEGKREVSVDVSSFLDEGDDYSVYDVQNLMAEPVLQGVLKGSVISLPMSLTQAESPFGNVPEKPAHTGSEFGVFLVVGQPRGARDMDTPAFELKKCYPNPTVDIVSVEFYNSSFERIEAEVFDEEGHKVHQEGFEARQGTNKLVLNLAKLNSGIYLIVLTKKDKTKITCKVLKHAFSSSDASWPVEVVSSGVKK